jgi:glycerol dehydrogenase-like iron-containing ADH family enzyme
MGEEVHTDVVIGIGGGIVLVDSQAIAQAPVRFLAAGSARDWLSMCEKIDSYRGSLMESPLTRHRHYA